MDRKRIRLKVAAPCSENWDRMRGDNAVRFCGSCEKNVYQLSAMSAEQIENLLAERSGGVCGRFYQRADGTVMTSDCAPGLARRRRKVAIAGIGAGLLSALGLALSGGGESPSPQPTAPQVLVEELRALENKVNELFTEEPDHVLMGDIAYVEQPHALMGKVAVEETPVDATLVLDEASEDSD